MPTYLVTGGAGFIGSHIAQALVERGDKVRVLDNLSTGRRENLRPIERQIELNPGREISLIGQSGRGKGNAVREGFAAARNEVLMILDGGSKRAAEVSERLFYPLWDAGFVVGHATRSPRDALPVRARRAMDPIEEVYSALLLGTRDYVRKNGFTSVVIGLSGGIDSALTAAIAADAVGPENVLGVAMPSRYSSRESLEGAKELASNLGIDFTVIPITELHDTFLSTLSESFAGREPDTTEENLQSRIRGTILMGLSNKFGHLVLATGNKSELATGYSTLYGDMAGGFAVLKDVPKTLLYRLALHRNAESEVIPGSILTKAPSAELKPDQTDQDTLPPYDLLDAILEAYVEEDRSPEEIARMGFDRETVQRVVRLVDTAEYKRRQAPPGVKITRKAFGRDRRYPITNAFRRIGVDQA